MLEGKGACIRISACPSTEKEDGLFFYFFIKLAGADMAQEDLGYVGIDIATTKQAAVAVLDINKKDAGLKVHKKKVGGQRAQ